MQQADDFLEESRALLALLEPLEAKDFERATAFKGWTINNVLAHLSLWNTAAQISLSDPDRLKQLMAELGQSIRAHGSVTVFEGEWHEGAVGGDLVERWWSSCEVAHEHFAVADPAQRVPWAGPDMSARSSISARLMETWAHGQEVFDELGVVRKNTDRLINIVMLGINTYGWTFRNRKEDIPEPQPYVVLNAPSGEAWTFGEAQDQERIEGSAEGFCQVVTQVRNVADTDLEVHGEIAQAWMNKAQCFAGPPSDPPAPGVRRTREL